MRQYLDLLRDVRENGVYRPDRTGTGTYSVFGRQLRHDLGDGLPMVTTKKVFLKGVIHELIWFLSGETNIKYLNENGVHIWDEWADEQGELGPVYGAQWRNWDAGNGTTIDQVQDVIHQLTSNPESRRIIISGWNVADLERMALPPCHTLYQFYVADGKLSCQLYQRSADCFLGLVFNQIGLALLTMMIAQVTGFKAGEIIHTLGDAHIYANHIEQVDEQLRREPYPLPTMTLNPKVTDLFEFKYEDFTLSNYQHHPAIKAPIAV